MKQTYCPVPEPGNTRTEKAAWRRHKRRRQKYRSWDADDVSELVYNRRYQAWADRQARAAEEEAGEGNAEGASSQQACVKMCQTPHCTYCLPRLRTLRVIMSGTAFNHCSKIP